MNGPADMIRKEIARKKWVSFARFMDLALYAPGTGYYEQPRSIGRSGDFFTSVSVGPLFGQLLGSIFTRWIEAIIAAPAPCQVVEAGAHDGRLAFDLLTTFQERHPALFARLNYWLIEPSPSRRTLQKSNLQPFLARVSWFDNWSSLPTQVNGAIFSNELLDAFPVHRFIRRDSGWMETGVIVDETGFAWSERPADLATLPLPADLREALPVGFILEASPAAVAWWREAARALGHGVLAGFDYGYTLEELPGKSSGTLRAYSKHQLVSDLLQNPGGQDLTAHVDFSALQAAGEASDLQTLGLISQQRLLTRAVEGLLQYDPGFFSDSSRVRQFQTLTHPEHMGRAFRVLVQSKGSLPFSLS